MNINSSILDKAAISLSAVCIAHCLLIPVILVFLPSVAASQVNDEELHRLLVGFVVPLSLLAVAMGCRKHRKYSIVMWGVAGLFLVILAAFFGHKVFGERGEKILTMLGSLLIVFSHIKNQRLCKAVKCTCHQ